MSEAAADVGRFSLSQTASKYWMVFTVCLSERFAYRTDFFVATLMRFMPIVTIIFLWTAIFKGSDRSQIAGFTQGEMVAYNLLVFISRAFSSMPGLTIGIATDIREGNIKKYLTQPVDMIGFLLTMRVAHKLVYYFLATIPYAIVLYLCRGFFNGWPPIEIFALYILSLFCGFLIGFLFDTLVGMTAFWTLEITSLSYLMLSVVFILSGHMFPLDLLPETMADVLRWLPFQYLAYFPAKLFLHGENMSAGMLTFEITRMVCCVFVLLTLVLAVYRRGLKRYSAFGG